MLVLFLWSTLFNSVLPTAKYAYSCLNYYDVICRLRMQNYDGDTSDLSLDFTVTEESLGKRDVVELKPGGKDICVTNENKLQYVHAMADYKLNRQVVNKICTVSEVTGYDIHYVGSNVQILPFSNAFYRGLSDLISPSWLKLFNAAEFNQVFHSLRYASHTVFASVYISENICCFSRNGLLYPCHCVMYYKWFSK